LGGAIADRARKRMVLLATQTAQMILAFVLGLLVLERMATFPIVLVLAFLLGVANAVDMPTRQAFVPELVGTDDLLNAIALNSTLFNAARLIGPALAGLLIGAIGIAGCFFLNGVSFIAVIVGLLMMSGTAARPAHPESLSEVIEDLREGFQYVRHSPTLMSVVLLVGTIGTFGMNFNVIAPVMAQRTLGVGAQGLGWIMAAAGFGSLIASLWLAYFSGRALPRIMLGAAIAFSLFEIVLAFVTSFGPALLFFGLIGASMVTFTALANSFIQLIVPNRLRGRVMSIYTSVFVGTTPIGNTVVGALAQSTGIAGPLILGGVASLAATVVFGRKLWKRGR
jgi:MFS family permease